MPKQSWEQVEELFHRATQLEPERRRSFLQQASGHDPVLVREVESLLTYEQSSTTFIEDRALLACQLLADCDLEAPPAAGAAPEGKRDAGEEGAPDPLLGQTVSRFRIVEKLGSGGMGVVYKAEDLKLGRFVALKFLKQPGAYGAGSGAHPLDQLYREARTASALDHPNICTIHEVDQHNGSPFIVMQLLVGRSLKQEIAGGPLATERILEFGIQCANALEAAHAAGIIHRDIKSANIFLTQREEVKVLDFGVAKSPAARTPEEGAPASAEGAAGATLMRPGAAFGTVAYMSPQQILGEPLDARTDLFSLGIVLYEVATGRLPFQGQNAAEVLTNILHQEPESPSRLNPTLSDELSKAILRALAKDPEKRYRSAAELREVLVGIREARQAAVAVPQNRSWRYWLSIFAAAGIALACAAGYLYVHHRKTGAPNPARRDAVVLADFANNTGEAVFDETLNQALRVQLEQSPYLNVLSPQSIEEEQQYMGLKPGDAVSADTALKICQRTGSNAMLSGSIASLGSHYVLNLNVVNCQNGDTIDAEQAEVATREAVLPALGRAAHKVRSKLGESLASVQRFDAPVEEATTPSLEALRAYGLGLKTWYAEGEKPSIPFFVKATELDPHFAMAYARLGNAYFETNQLALGREAVSRAYALRDRVSERERLYIESHYYEDVSGELDQAVRALQLWQETYPDDPAPYVNLGADYTTLGQHTLALEQDRKALAMEPNLGLLYSNLAMEYASLEDYSDAEKTLRAAQARGLQYATLIGSAYQLAFLRGDTAEMQRQVQRGMGHPWTEAWLLALEADTAAYYGRRSQARELTQRAADSARRNDDQETAVGYQLMDALRDAEYGFPSRARTTAQQALAADHGQQTQVLGALALARAGDTGDALAIARELAKRFPDDTMLNDYWLPTIRAAVQLSASDAAAALNSLQVTVPYALASPKTPTTAALYPVYLRAQALLAIGDAPGAGREFQKILSHRGIAQNYLLAPLAQLGLARACTMMSHAQGAATSAAADDSLAQARAAYQKFLALWAKADPGIPILQQAKAEYQAQFSGPPGSCPQSDIGCRRGLD